MTSDHSAETHRAPGTNSEFRFRRKVRASIFILPNSITALSLFFGFLSIRFGFESRFTPLGETGFTYACYAIMASVVCDGLDGSVARLTRTQSAFGVQLDSLSDLIAFGLAPAFLAYNFALHELGRLGFAACFAYATCGALRLARFNVQSTLGKAGGNFTGIPTPMAALPVAVLILSQIEMSQWNADVTSEMFLKIARTLTDPTVRRLGLLTFIMVVAFGMISTFEYISTKSIRLPKKYPFRVFALAMITLIFLLTWEFTFTLSVLAVAYVIHGPLMWLFFKRDRGAEEEELFSADDPEDEEEVLK